MHSSFLRGKSCTICWVQTIPDDVQTVKQSRKHTPCPHRNITYKARMWPHTTHQYKPFSLLHKSPNLHQRKQEGKRNLLAKTGPCKSPAKNTTASRSCILHFRKHKQGSASQILIPALPQQARRWTAWGQMGLHIAGKHCQIVIWTNIQADRTAMASLPQNLSGSGFKHTSKCFLRATGLAHSLGKLPWGSLFLLLLSN